MADANQPGWRERLNAQTILTLLLSGGGALFYFSGALLGLASMALVLAQDERGKEDLFTYLALVCMLAAVGALLLLAGWRALRALVRGGAANRWRRLSKAAWVGLALAWLALLGVGQLAAMSSGPAWVILPLLQIIVVLLPVYGLLAAARRGLEEPMSAGSRPGAGLFSFGLTVTPVVVIVVELLLLLAVLAAVLIWALADPLRMTGLNRLAQRLAILQADPAAMERVLLPYLQNPQVVGVILLVGAGMIPAVEELIKPLGLWGLAGRRAGPVQGFYGGLICGAAFALVESFGMLANFTGAGWGVVALGRFGTAALHMAASALVGWGMASAWSEGRYLRLLGAYFTAVLLHGLWNAASLTVGLAALSPTPALEGGAGITGLALASPLVLGAVALGNLFILASLNRHLNRL